MLKDKNILIIGGAGMIGSTVAKLTYDKGARLTVYDAMLPLYGGNMFNLENIQDKLEFIKGDIRDENKLNDVVKGKDYIFNLAAQVSYVKSNKEPFLDLDINCKGILNVLEACRRNAPDAKIVFSSSRFVYGSVDYNPVDEHHPYNCRSIYGIHKLTGEKYHRYYYDAYGLNTTSIRIANPYGPKQQMKHSEWGIVNWFIRLALDSKPLTVYGKGEQKRDYIFVDDIAGALISCALSENTKGKVYNVGSGTGTAFVEMANTIAEMVPGTIVNEVEWPKERYFVETGDYVTNNKKITSDTGWLPQTDFETGLIKTIEYYQKFREHYWGK